MHDIYTKLAEILEATQAKPFLSFVLQIDPSVVRQVTSDMLERRTTAFRQQAAENEPPDPPAFVSALDQELAGAVLGFLRSIETGADHSRDRGREQSDLGGPRVHARAPD